jgi:hypothetical protein
MYRKSDVKNNKLDRNKSVLKQIIKKYIKSNMETGRYGDLYLTYDEIKELQQRFKRGEWNGRRLKR